MEQDRDNLQEGIRAALNEAGLLNSEIGIVGDAVEVTLPSEDEADRARDVINGLQQGLAITSPADNRLRVVFTEAALRERTNAAMRSEEHTSELQSLMRISYAVFCLKKQKHNTYTLCNTTTTTRS